MNKIVKAILAINPKAEVGIDGNDIDACKIEWLNGTSEISKTDIKAKMTSMAYIGKREAEYPTIANQLDDIYHNGIDAWKTTIKTIKDKYPKS